MPELSQMASLRNSMFFLKYSLKYFEPLPGNPINQAHRAVTIPRSKPRSVNRVFAGKTYTGYQWPFSRRICKRAASQKNADLKSGKASQRNWGTDFFYLAVPHPGPHFRSLLCMDGQRRSQTQMDDKTLCFSGDGDLARDVCGHLCTSMDVHGCGAEGDRSNT